VLADEHVTGKALTVGLVFEDYTALVTVDVMEELNQNLIAHQRDLILWHHNWAHCDMGHVQTLLANSRDSSLSQSIEPKHGKASSCPKPKCVECCLIKGGRASAPTMQVHDTSKHNLNDNVIHPCDVIHLDQCMLGFPGRLPTIFGKEKPKKRFTGGHHLHIWQDRLNSSSSPIVPASWGDISRQEQVQEMFRQFNIKFKSL
jgi:hypothetical protein